MSLPPAEPDPIHDLLSSVKSVVLEGVPGTGKTYAVQTLAEHWFERTGRRLLELDGQPYAAMVMHPSTSYEDFVEGLRPGKDVNAHEAWFDEPAQGDRDFSVEDGFFLRVCAAAVRHPERDVLVLLDELNRCNVPSVLGDLLLVLEASRRARPTVERGPVEAGAWTAVTPAKLPYSGRLFFVPSNVYVLATTNTTDRSVAPLDAAVRRRFAFYRLEPELVGVQALADHLPTEASRTAHTCIRMIDRLNADVLGPCIGPDALLGQSYLYSLVAELQEASSEAVVSIAARAIRYQVLPQLTEATRSYGAEDLLSPAAREEWFAHHEGAMSGAPQANAVLADFDAFLRSLGIQVVVEGTGLARGVRVRDAVNPRPRVDISFPSDADADPESVAQVDETPATTRDE